MFVQRQPAGSSDQRGDDDDTDDDDDNVGSDNNDDDGVCSCRDSLLVPAINAGTSVFAGLVVFATLGHLAALKNVDVGHVMQSGQYSSVIQSGRYSDVVKHGQFSDVIENGKDADVINVAYRRGRGLSQMLNEIFVEQRNPSLLFTVVTVNVGMFCALTHSSTDILCRPRRYD